MDNQNKLPPPSFEQETTNAIESVDQPQSPLVGERQTGIVDLPNGASIEHRVSGDGMKYSRQVGERWKSAAEFHAAQGVATPAEMERVQQEAAPTKSPVNVKRLADKIISITRRTEK